MTPDRSIVGLVRLIIPLGDGDTLRGWGRSMLSDRERVKLGWRMTPCWRMAPGCRITSRCVLPAEGVRVTEAGDRRISSSNEGLFVITGVWPPSVRGVTLRLKSDRGIDVEESKERRPIGGLAGLAASLFGTDTRRESSDELRGRLNDGKWKSERLEPLEVEGCEGRIVLIDGEDLSLLDGLRENSEPHGECDEEDGLDREKEGLDRLKEGDRLTGGLERRTDE